MYDWDPDSTYVQEPPFFDDLDDAVAGGNIEGARVLVKVGDSHHHRPHLAGRIDQGGLARGGVLKARGVSPAEFNSYGARRGNHEVMMRGTFANIRLRNEMAPGTEGPWTTYLPDGDLMTVFDAAGRYREAGCRSRPGRQGVRQRLQPRLGGEGPLAPRRAVRDRREL